MAMHDDYCQMLTTAIPTLTQIDGNQLRAGVPFHHQRTEGIHPIVKKPVNPDAQRLLESVLQQTAKPDSVPQTIITHLKPPETVEGSQAAAAGNEEEKKE